MKQILQKYYLIVALISCFRLVNAQSFMNIDVAQNFSTFKFSSNILDDENLINDNQKYNQISSIAYGIGYTNLQSSGLFFSGGLGFRKAGASLIYKKNSFLWELQYIDAKIGVGYLYSRWIVKPYVYVMPYYAYLLSAKQSSGLNYYDIKTDNALKSHDLGLLLNAGLKVPVSYYADIFAEYNYNLGLRNIETAPEQFLYNRGFAIKLGLSINITNFKKAQQQISAGNFNYISPNDSAQSSNTELQSLNENNITPVKTIQSNEGLVNDTNENEGLNNQPNSSPILSNTENSNKTNSSEGTKLVESNNDNVTEPLATDNSNIPTPNNSLQTASNSENKPPVSQAQKNNNPNTTNQIQSSKSSPNKDDKVDFKIQLTAVKNPLGADHPIYKNFKGNIKSEKGKDGWLRYYLGSFESYEDALKELRRIKGKGGLDDGGFIVAFKNNKKISVAEAKELLK